MNVAIDRRGFVGAAVAATLAATTRAAAPESWFTISLAQWSLHRAYGRTGKATLDPMDFAKHAKMDYHIDAIEYVNQFYKEQVKNGARLASELKKRADDYKVRSVLIMCDGEGNLGDPDARKRQQAVDNHKKWLELAQALGCHSIRVNAASSAKLPPEEQSKLAADGLRKLCEAGDTFGLNVIVENHGGMSSNGKWLAGTIKRVDHKRAGTLPDFGNFKINDREEYDRYQGVAELMPFAKGVSAKSHDFDANGNETHTDYKRMMKIVHDAGYRSFVGIEYEGGKMTEPEGIRATRRLLEAIRASA